MNRSLAIRSIDIRLMRAKRTIDSNRKEVYPIMNRAVRTALRKNMKSIKILVTPY